MRQKCLNRFRDIHAKVPKLFLQKCWIWMLQQYFQLKDIEKVSTLFGNFSVRLESFQSVWKLFGPSGKFPDSTNSHCQENFQTKYLETFRTNWKLSSPSRKFPVRLKTFRTVWKISRLSKNFPDILETFQTVLKLSRQSGNFLH